MNKRLLVIGTTVLTIFIWQANAISQDHDDHEGHDHSTHKKGEEEKAGTDDHSDHDEDDDHSDNEGEENEDHSLEVELSDDSIKIIGLSLEKVKEHKLKKNIRLTGEVDFDQDRLVHLVPRFPGIAKNIKKSLGDKVKPNETVAVIESNESLSLFDVKSLIGGTIVDKHITLGEFVSDSEPIYKIADLDKVWVNFAVYSKDIMNAKIGQEVNIQAIGNKINGKGKISYIAKVFDEKTRFVTARVVLSNPDELWRPGMFVSGTIEQDTKKKSKVVKNTAIQIINEKQYVFVPESKNVFHATEVKTGKTDSTYTEIISGLDLNDSYVVYGAFELKSKIAISAQGGGAHAGHGH